MLYGKLTMERLLSNVRRQKLSHAHDTPTTSEHRHGCRKAEKKNCATDGGKFVKRQRRMQPYRTLLSGHGATDAQFKQLELTEGPKQH